MEQQLKPFVINVGKVTRGNKAISSDDGQMLHDRLLKILNEKKNATVDFKNINLIVSSFLNSAFGQLVEKFDIDSINRHIRVDNISDDDRELLKKVLETAELYFKRKDSQKTDMETEE